jgi:hypothetical protein
MTDAGRGECIARSPTHSHRVRCSGPIDPPIQRVYVSAVDGSTHGSDAGRELSESRASAAHGPEPESRTPATPAPVAPPRTGVSRSLWQRMIATRWSRLAWASAALVVVVGAITVTAVLVTAPRPDATMHLTAAEPDDLVQGLAAASEVQVDGSTLQGYGSFLGLEIWSGTDRFGSQCLMSVNRANDTLSDLRCAPAPAELFMDIASIGDDYDGLLGEGLIRFVYRGDTVDAYIHLMPGTD